MHAEIPVFKAERDAGLAEAVRATGRIATASLLKLSAPPHDVPERATTRLRERASASQADCDLHYIDTVLVTTGWNNNDDYFEAAETYAARKTPEDKQLNYEHDCSQIVGHVTKSWVVADDHAPIAEDTATNALPAKFHIFTGGVLYRYWEKADLQKRMDDLLAGIARGEWFVSMECLFSDFSFALATANGAPQLVTRNGETAFLTKHLRAYGGGGSYGGRRIGRVLRDIVFSGKGLVRNPANPESVILPGAAGSPELETAVASYFRQAPSVGEGKATLGVAKDIRDFLASR